LLHLALILRPVLSIFYCHILLDSLFTSPIGFYEQQKSYRETRKPGKFSRIQQYLDLIEDDGRCFQKVLNDGSEIFQ